jgi:hypothetical protein
MSAATNAAAVWAYATRTLATGTPGAPASRADTIAAATWAYATRTVTAAGMACLPGPGAGVMAGGGTSLGLGIRMPDEP